MDAIENPVHCFTVDLEDWFCSHCLRKALHQSEWKRQSLRVTLNTQTILRLLDSYKTKATFFVLGWIAEQAPNLIQEIVDHGHEIAIHGYDHSLLNENSKYAFQKDLEMTLSILSKLVPNPIEGYRAPAFSLTNKTIWALSILKDFGIKYDSSFRPRGIRPFFNVPGKDTTPYQLDNGIIEFPISCISLMGLHIPFSGGAYFRFIPFLILKQLFKRYRSNPIILYVHPWEMDNFQPPMNITGINRIRMFYNRSKTYEKLLFLLNHFHFTSIRNYLNKTFSNNY